MIPISYQLYSSRHHEPDETFAMLERVGIDQVEGYAPYYDDVDATRRRLDAHGLSMPSGHFAVELVESEPTRCIEVARALGIEGVIVPFLAPDQRPADADGWRRFSARLAEAGKPIRDAGLRYGWHNHEFEFQPLTDGILPIDCLAETSPEIEFELDLAWIHVAGHDPAVWLERLSGRILAAHVKDRAPSGENADEDGWADVGHGIMDWAAIVPAMVAAGVPRYVLEHDNPADPERFARRSFATVAGFRA